jgi:hypothetical protein
MPDDQLQLSESAWVRGWRDTTRDLADWRFWLVEVVGGGLLGIYYAHLLPSLLFVLGMALYLWITATALAPIRQRNEARMFIETLQSGPALSVIFPQEANSPATVSPFRQVTAFLLRGRPLAPPHPTQYEFSIGVTNNTPKTIKHVGIRVVAANMPDRPINVDLIAKKTEGVQVDIAPKLTEFFRLGSVVRREEGSATENS